jgi:hypothetical protein
VNWSGHASTTDLGDGKVNLPGARNGANVPISRGGILRCGEECSGSMSWTSEIDPAAPGSQEVCGEPSPIASTELLIRGLVPRASDLFVSSA